MVLLFPIAEACHNILGVGHEHMVVSAGDCGLYFCQSLVVVHLVDALGLLAMCAVLAALEVNSIGEVDHFSSEPFADIGVVAVDQFPLFEVL